MRHSGTSTYRMRLHRSKEAGFYSHVWPMESDKFAIPPSYRPREPYNAPPKDSLHCGKQPLSEPGSSPGLRPQFPASVHGLQFVDHALDDFEALVPKLGIARIQPERRKKLGMVF